MGKGKAVSSGGIVLREISNELKFALARDPEKGDNAWVIPKGHVKEGESLEETAIREIKEEVGLVNVKLIKYLGAILRESIEDWGEVVQKTIHIYLAYALNQDQTLKITDPSLTEAGWFSAEEALEVIPFKEDREFLKDKLSSLFHVSMKK